MTQTTHTPGPWNNSDDGRIYATGEIVADATYGCLSRAETDANALLIAAAPDLLAALETIANSEPMDGDSFVCDFDTLQSVARAALRKAKGE